MPLLGNGAELQFLGGNIEITAQLAPVVGAAVRAQEAVLRDDASRSRASSCSCSTGSAT